MLTCMFQGKGRGEAMYQDICLIGCDFLISLVYFYIKTFYTIVLCSKGGSCILQ